LRKTLEEFYYLKSSRSFEDVNKFLILISNCTQLRVLDVSQTSVDVSLITRTSDLLERQERNHALLIRCANTKINPVDIQVTYSMVSCIKSKILILLDFFFRNFACQAI